MHKSTATKLRASEAYIKDILKSMPLMLIGVNKDGKITQWNKRAEEITGIKTENMLGKNLWDAYSAVTVSPEQINDVIEAVQRQAPGTWLPLKISRGSEIIEIIAKFSAITK